MFFFSCGFEFELGNERTHRLLWVLKFDILIYFNSCLHGSCKLVLKKKLHTTCYSFQSSLEFIDFFFSIEFIDFFPHLAKFKLNVYKENKILCNFYII